MHCYPITSGLGPGFVPGVVGCIGGLILHGDYDIDQLWFDFMAGSVMRIRDPKRPEPQPPQHRPRTWNTTGYARAGDHGRTMYLYVKGEEQLQLPYYELRSLTKSEHSRLQQSHFAGWDKLNGKPIVIPINPDTHRDVRKWCIENMEGRFHIKPNSLAIQLVDDAIMAKVFWQTSK